MAQRNFYFFTAPLSALTPLSTSPALPSMATKDRQPAIDDPPVIDCVVTPWSEWTSCTTTCGNGRRERRRMIKLNPENGGKPCPPKLVQRRKCKDNPPCREYALNTYFILIFYYFMLKVMSIRCGVFFLVTFRGVLGFVDGLDHANFVYIYMKG